MFRLSSATSNHTQSTVLESCRRDHGPSIEETSSVPLKGNGSPVGREGKSFILDESPMSEIMDDVNAADKKKRNRRRRKTKSRAQVEPVDNGEKKGSHSSPQSTPSKTTPSKRKSPSMYSGWRSSNKACPASMGGPTSTKQHDAPMKKRDLYFTLHCERVGIGGSTDAVARVSLVNWENEIVLDTFVQVPVPVTDFYDTGITADDINPNTNPQVQCFSTVRRTVESTLLGKILIGQHVQQDLHALGLSHPWTDVRDCAHFAPFTYEVVDSVTSKKTRVARSLDDLRKEVLQKSTASVGDASRPIQYCVTALDLYKLYRKEWEESLAAKAREHDSTLDHRHQSTPMKIHSLLSPPHSSSPGTKVRNHYPQSPPRDSGIHQHQPRARLSSATTLEEGIVSLHCDTVRTATFDAVARVTMVNAANDLLYDSFVQIPVQVLDFKQTGITAENVSPRTNPHALRLNVVRRQVDELLRGCHLLVGYKIDQHLMSLGLAYPWTQVRDTAYFKPFMLEEMVVGAGETIPVERSLNDLSLAMIQKPLVGPAGFISSFRSCMTTLELYKLYREQWEEQETYLMQQRQQERAEQMSARRHGLVQGPPNQVFASSMVASYTTPGIVTPPQVLTPERGNSSWFASWGRKQQYREYQVDAASSSAIATPASTAMLSPQALQVLREEASIFSTSAIADGTGSYYGESSSHLEESSTYATSAHYTQSNSSVLDDVSRNGSFFEFFPTESVTSSTHDETASLISADLTSTERLDTEGIPSFEPQGGHASVGLPKNGSPSSSWFRFGSRKSRYSSQSCVSMAAVQETDEPEEMVRSTSSAIPLSNNDIPLSSSNHRSTSLVSDTSSLFLEQESNPEPQASRVWFGFRRRSISPGRGPPSGHALRPDSPMIPSESCKDNFPNGTFDSEREGKSDVGSDAIQVTLTDQDKHDELLERPISDCGAISATVSTERSSSSWFGLRRPKSPSFRHGPLSQDLEEAFQAMSAPTSETANGIVFGVGPATTVIEEDWLKEVVDRDSVLSNDELHSSVDLSWLDKDQCAMPTGKAGTGPKSQPSSWFGFKRSKSSSRKESRLAAASEHPPSDPMKAGKKTDSFADNTMRTADAWPKDVGGRDIESSHLGPSWYFAADSTLSRSESFSGSSTSDVVDNDNKNNNVFTGRGRLSTESTLPTVATEEHDADEDKEYDDEFDKGMEQNFAFLEI